MGFHSFLSSFEFGSRASLGVPLISLLPLSLDPELPLGFHLLLFFFEFGSQASLGIPLVSLLLLPLDPKLSLDSQLNAHLSDGTEDPSVSVGVG